MLTRTGAAIAGGGGGGGGALASAGAVRRPDAKHAANIVAPAAMRKAIGEPVADAALGIERDVVKARSDALLDDDGVAAARGTGGSKTSDGTRRRASGIASSDSVRAARREERDVCVEGARIVAGIWASLVFASASDVCVVATSTA